ncbi:hypothetical protein [Oryzihumus sp.]|jgi:hypothetical protein|uniref:hypothetical protein n=1 Tax=Oryzihumus sp. TaxID=1968903 RepID=UPI002ED78F36
MQAALVVTWTHPIAGREQKSLDYAQEVQTFWSKQASEGRCSEPQLFFSERGTGLWVVTGERETLMQIHDSDEARLLTLKGELLLESFSADIVYAGDSAADYLMRYSSALATLG